VNELTSQLKLCKQAFRELRTLSASRKNAVLSDLAKLLVQSEKEILAANVQDQNVLSGDRATGAFRDRLMLNEQRLGQMAESLNQVAGLPDPVGEIADETTLPNGLKLQKVRAPLGVLFMIFESRPNVITEAFSLAFKSGNVIILRGGKETFHTSQVIYRLIQEALGKQGMDKNTFWGITDPDRAITQFLLQQSQWIDVVIPRGGDALIEYVVQNSKMPIIKNDRGLCHVYIHQDADPKSAVAIVENAKAQRPGVCNSMETLLIHHSVAKPLLPQIYAALTPAKVEWFGCEKTREILKGLARVFPATEKSWDTEYLDYKMNCLVVENEEEAFSHIEKHGSRHSEAIVTRDAKLARRFQAEIDAAAVYWNASTRFTDGFEFGLGGELGISTQKIHVRGPVGLRELTSLRWIGTGTGQVRTS
jgi:glutamate-5-semialdehyde dehydrogenase